MNTKLEKNFFSKHWRIFLKLIERVAFDELKFNKIFTYAFDLRPHLYKVIEECGFDKEATLIGQFYNDNTYKDVIIHSKFNNRQ